MGGSVFGFTERIDEIRDETFFGSFFFDGFLFVFNDDFVVGDFDDFASRDDELGVDKRLEGGAFDNELFDEKIFGGDGKISDAAELGAFFGFDFEGEKVEVEFEDVGNLDDVVGGD